MPMVRICRLETPDPEPASLPFLCLLAAVDGAASGGRARRKVVMISPGDPGFEVSPSGCDRRGRVREGSPCPEAAAQPCDRAFHKNERAIGGGSGEDEPGDHGFHPEWRAEIDLRRRSG